LKVALFFLLILFIYISIETLIRNASKRGKPNGKPYHPYGFRNLYSKQSINEENSSLFMNSILQKDKSKCRNLRSDKSQGYLQKPQRNCTSMNSISVCMNKRLWESELTIGHIFPPPLSGQGGDTAN
jgi:hypothetical protein